MILRKWSGIVKAGLEKEYIDHLKNSTFPSLMKLDGFIVARIMSRKVNKGTEFCITTEWESIESIRAFSGSNTTVAVVPPEAKQLMVSYDKEVKHYEIIT